MTGRKTDAPGRHLRRRPRRRGRFAGAALATVLVAEVAARVVSGAAEAPALRWHDRPTQVKAEQLAGLGDVDVVVIGTSMAQQGLVPDALGDALDASVYNAALNGGVPAVMEPWLLDEVVPRVHPDVVVWGLSALDLSLAYGDAIVDAYETAPATRTGILGEADRTASRFSVLVRDRRLLRDPSALFGSAAEQAQQEQEAAETLVGDDGERIAFEPDRSHARQRETQARITPFLVDRDDLAAIARTADALRGEGRRLVLVELPVPPRFTALYPDGAAQHAVVGDTLDALADVLDVPLVRLAELGPDGAFDDADFVDFTHLDRDPAARFAAAVGRAIATLD